MLLRVLGCHGGETPRHRTCAFLLDDRVAIDAGSLTSGMELREQYALETVLVSHAHLDHVRDLATIADNRAQAGRPPLVIAGIKPTIAILKKHFFNGKLWPDFTAIPSVKKPTIAYLELKPEKATRIGAMTVTPILVSHTIDTCAFLVEKGGDVIAYSGDTGPTDRLWEVLSGESRLRALLMEVSFPNAEHRLAAMSGHHTPATLAKDLRKLREHKHLPVLLYHIKPMFQREVERECAKLRGAELTILAEGDRFVL